MRPRPLLGRLDRRWLIILPPLCYIVGERVVRVGGSEQCLDGQQNRPDLESGGPIV